LSLFTGNLGYSIRGYVAAFFSFVALRLDVLLIQYLLDAEQAGYYSVAVSLTDVLYMLPVTVGAILFPKLSGMPEDAQRWQYAKKVVSIVAVLMAGIAIVALFGARPLITILYGVPFEPATAAFVWLLPGIVLLSVSSLLINGNATSRDVLSRLGGTCKSRVERQAHPIVGYCRCISKHDRIGWNHVDRCHCLHCICPGTDSMKMRALYLPLLPPGLLEKGCH
jgi:hypothetical protein